MENYVHQEDVRAKEAKKVTLVGFYINAVLTLFKVYAGITGKSAAMVADGVHSLSDFFTDIVVLIGFKFINKPEDEDHNYGHGKYETVATLIISFALFIVGYKIFTSGIINIYQVVVHGKIIESPSLIALIAAAVSIVSKELLYRYTKHVGEKINSQAVIANGWHHRSDAFSSIGTLIGIGGAIVLGERWTILDPIASVIVSVFIFKVAFEILTPAFNELMEVSLKPEEIERIKQVIDSNESILDYHHLRTRRIGIKVAIEVHLLFAKDQSIEHVHEHASEVESALKELFSGNCIITTHLEPYHEA